MPLEELRPTNNYVTYEQLQRFLTDRLGALEREIEAKLLQLKESKFNYLEEKLNIKTELEALKEQFRLLNSEFISRVTNLSYKVIEINNFFTQKLAELNQQFTDLNTKIISELEKYRTELREFLSKSDLRSFLEENADLVPYLMGPAINEIAEMKNKLSSIETNLLLIQNSWATISNEISKHISQLIESTLSDIDSKVLGLTNSLKESLLEKINSLEINGEIDLSGINEFKDEISNLINNVNQNIAELKNIYQSISSSETTAQTINFDQVLGEINIKLDEIKFAQAQREFVVPEFPDAEYLKNFSEEMRAGLETLKKISEEISLSTSSLTFNPSVKFDESLQEIDTQIREIKTLFDEMATSQFEIQNNIGNLAEKVTVVVTEVPKISGTLKKDISEEFKVLKSELLSELKKQGQSLTSSINSINESVQSLKGYPAIIIFATLIIIGAMILLKFVF
jgi:hypothetical protein